MKKISLLLLIVFITISIQAQNKLLSSIDEYYNGALWVNGGGSNYEYDSNNNLIAETYYSWNTGNWEISDKATYTYNANNKITYALYQVWNPATNTFENFDRDTYAYTNGKITEIGYDRWVNSNWVNDDKSVISYNISNLPESAIFYNWDGSQWVNQSRATLTYSPTNKVISEVDEEWINSQWVNDYKTLYTYDSNNKIITTKSASWDEFNSIWVESDQTDYELDATGNRIRETNFYNFSGFKNEYTYDTSMLMSSFANPFEDKTGFDYLFEDYPFVNKVLLSNGFSYNSNTSSYENTSRTTYNYANSITLGTETLQLATAAITIFPNPTKDYLSIQNQSNTEIDKVTVTDMTGKIILQQNKKSNQVDVQNFAKGMYLLQVFSGDKKWQSKFLKE